jgi:hypothetical protein
MFDLHISPTNGIGILLTLIGGVSSIAHQGVKEADSTGLVWIRRVHREAEEEHEARRPIIDVVYRRGRHRDESWWIVRLFWGINSYAYALLSLAFRYRDDTGTLTPPTLCAFVNTRLCVASQTENRKFVPVVARLYLGFDVARGA